MVFTMSFSSALSMLAETFWGIGLRSIAEVRSFAASRTTSVVTLLAFLRFDSTLVRGELVANASKASVVTQKLGGMRSPAFCNQPRPLVFPPTRTREAV